jgi:hypothetical protein
VSGARFRFDADAALWFAVALVATAFATIPMLSIALALLGHPIDDVSYIAATGALTSTAFAVTAGLLVVVRPWRTYRDTLLTLYVLQLGAAGLLAIGQFVRSPGNVLLVVRQILPPLSFGFLQIDSFSPLEVAFPEAWPLVGTFLGLLVARRMLASQGRAVGEAARVTVEPMRLPKP